MRNWYGVMKHAIEIVRYRPGRILQIMKNALLDFRFGGKYLGVSLQNSNEKLGYIYTGSSEYDAIEAMFSRLTIGVNDVLVDVGCGKGRVLNWWLSKKLKNKLIGIEVDPAVAEFTRKRLKAYSQVEIRMGEGQHRHMLNGGTVFYLNHSFREPLVRVFEQSLAEMIADDPSLSIRLVYHNSVYLHVFEENPLWCIEHLGVINNLSSVIVRGGATQR